MWEGTGRIVQRYEANTSSIWCNGKGDASIKYKSSVCGIRDRKLLHLAEATQMGNYCKCCHWCETCQLFPNAEYLQEKRAQREML